MQNGFKKLIIILIIAGITPWSVFAVGEPTTTTGATSSINVTSATLGGSITTFGTSTPTIRGFEYGLTAGYGSTVSESGSYSPSFGLMSSFGNTGSPTSNRLLNPQGVFLDSSSNIYVADTARNRVQKYNSSGGFLLRFGSAGTANGQFGLPKGIAVDGSGNIFVTDNNNKRVQKFNSSGVYQSKFGSSGTGDGQFGSTMDGIVFDSGGNIYVVDPGNNRVQKFDSSGVYISQFGSYGAGDGQFDTPSGIAIDSGGNIYVVDTNNHRVQKFNSSGVYQSQFGSNGAGNGELESPSGINFDTYGNIFVADVGNNRIQKFDSSGTYIMQYSTGLTTPYGVVVNANNETYVSNTGQSKITKLNYASISYSLGITGLTCGTTYHYRAYSTNASGTGYGSDATFTTSNCAPTLTTSSASSIAQTTATFNGNITNTGISTPTVRGFEYGTTQSYGSTITENGSFSTGAYTASATSLLCGTTYYYRSYATNTTGTGYGSESTFDTTGNCTPSVSTTSSSSVLDTTATITGDITSIGVEAPNIRGFEYGLTTSYGSTVSESGSFSTGSFSLPVTTLTCGVTYRYRAYATNSYGTSTGSNDTFTTICGPDVQTGNASLVTQNTSTISGDILDTRDSNATVRGFEYGPTASYGTTTTESGSFFAGLEYSSQFGTNGSGNGQFTDPEYLKVDSGDNVYVVDNNNYNIQKFNSSGVYQSQFGTSGSGNGQFQGPSDIDFDSLGNIYVVDSNNSRVQKFNSSGVYQSEFGTNGSGDGQFNFPRGIAIDSLDNIFVVDGSNHRIQKFNSSGVYQSQFGTNGSGDGQFAYPMGIEIDSNDNIYVADTNNRRIQKFNSSGVYQSQFGQYGEGNSEFINPMDISIDSGGNIYVIDTNRRIQKFNSSGVYQSRFGEYGTDNGQFRIPLALAFDSNDNLYVADRDNYRVQKLAKTTSSYTTSISSLVCGTTYHYRAYATNDGATEYGSDTTFTTNACTNPTSTTASTGSSAGSRIQNLYNMGKINEAQKVANQFPNAVKDINDKNIVKKLSLPSTEFTKKVTNTLRVGNTNPKIEVVTLQKVIGVEADGKFGPITLKAVKEFQTKNDLKPDGIVGPKTWAVVSGLVK
ncbi:MAG: tripartite motif-containing protein 71 [Patescibacteria group bacterium]|nr:tripartite motif-containing protein 71 [Patescibacteria group bacterium]